MNNKPISPELQARIRKAKAANPKLSTYQLSKQFGVGPTSVRKYLKDRPENGQTEEAHEVAGDKWTISLPKTRIHTLPQLLEYCEVDLTIWEVERFVCNKWEMGYKDVADVGQVMPLFQVKAFLKKKVHIVSALEEIQALKDQAKSAAKVVVPYKAKKSSGLMLEINIPDLHAGKLAWGKETGGPNYDTKIAVDTFWRAFDALTDRVKHREFEEVLFVMGNDLLNSDDIEGRTTAGTSVTTDGRYQKTFKVVREMKVEAIERLRKIAPVKVVPVSGNHDFLGVWHLGDSLECYFHKYKDVIVDNSPAHRKYHQFGDVMLLFFHGHKGKKTDYPTIMAIDQPKMFGATKFREVHCGHLHKTQSDLFTVRDIDEHHGIRVRILPALCPSDDWHSLNCFIGNKRSAELYVWDKKAGLIATEIYSEID